MVDEAPLTVYMSSRTTEERDVAFLRLYAEKVRAGTDLAWEIPNTRASTIEDIASRLTKKDAELLDLRTDRSRWEAQHDRQVETILALRASLTTFVHLLDHRTESPHPLSWIADVQRAKAVLAASPPHPETEGPR